MPWANTFQSALGIGFSEAGLEDDCILIVGSLSHLSDSCCKGDICTMVPLMAELLHHFGCNSPSKWDQVAHSQLVSPISANMMEPDTKIDQVSVFLLEMVNNFQLGKLPCTRYGHVENVTVCPPKEGAEVKKAPYAFATWQGR